MSEAKDLLVAGHLAAGRPGMAALALRLPAQVSAALDEALNDGKQRAGALAIIAVLLAYGELTTNGGTDE